jgi:hypothetical protein
MTTTVSQFPRAEAVVSRRGTIAALSLTGAAAVLFFAGAALPYFLSPAYGTSQYAGRRGWLLLHIAGGAVALLTGPVQLWLGLADRGIGWHRRMGVAYMTAVGASSIGAFYLAFHTDGGWAFGAGLASLAVAWISTTTMAFLAIRRSLIDQHKEWMIRSYVVTFGFVFFRIIFPVLQVQHIGTLNEQLAVAAWGCWSVPLLVNELVLQGRKILTVKPS